MALGHMSDEVDEIMKKTFKSSRSDVVRFDYKRGQQPAPPPVLGEPADMNAVASPCHPFEPVKVTEGWDEILHCLICGKEYGV